MSFHDIYKTIDVDEENPHLYSFQGRAEVIQSLKRKAACDVLVVGGGIHGAAFAHLAAFNGLNTVLLEKSDYASGTSSRSSKMAHGGLRYLELFDFQQVWEGIKAREDLFEVAPHLVKPGEFLIPVLKNERLFKLKLGFGLWFYDLLVRHKERKHRWINRDELPYSSFGESNLDLEGCYLYTDGIMDDARLVLEHIVAARQEGARCLNYAAVKSLMMKENGGVTVGWTDVFTSSHHEIYAGIVVNCAGPWVPMIGRVTPGALSKRVRYSRGAHLLFDKKWTDPALFLPLEEKARYYFVWPHFAGTLVGTTETEVTTLDDDPTPTEDEIERVLARLKKDLPGSGLDRSNLSYCFAGVRTLPLRRSGENTGRLSRKHIWSYSNGMLSLLGGKFTTARWTVFEGLKKIYKLTRVKKEPVTLVGRILPGAGMYKESVEKFRRRASASGVGSEAVEGAIRRLGSRVRFISENDKAMEELPGGSVLRGEIDLIIDMEQAETLEDIMRRRTGLEYLSGNGLDVVDEIAGILGEKRPALDVEAEIKHYRARIKRLRELMEI